jgi:hypothetical protein
VVNFLPLHVPSSSEPPSLYAASAVAFAVSVGTTEPVLGLPMAGLATAVLRRRIMVGGVGDVLTGGALGAAVTEHAGQRHRPTSGTPQARGNNPATRNLAQQIISAQQAEISEMQALLQVI